MITRRHAVAALLGAAGSTTVPAIAFAQAKAAAGTGSSGKDAVDGVLRFVPQADLRSIDPVFTPVDATTNHGYLIYDTLFALDEHYKVRPQMVGGHEVSEDGLRHVFKLRAGLAFHDGAPVRGADCVASIRRWAKRDVFGQKVEEFVSEIVPVGEDAFRIALKRPFPLLLDAFAKPGSNVLFIMPERVAQTDPYKQITDTTGSGPFIFKQDEFVPAHKAVYLRNPHYVPRDEPPSFAAGGKVARVARIEVMYMPDPATAASALQANEVDYWGQFPYDYQPLLKANKDLQVVESDPIGSLGVLRFNHTQPPFDDVLLRRAVLTAVNQGDFMSVVAGDRANWQFCRSVFPCGTPLSTGAGAEALRPTGDLEEARRLVKASSYAAQTVVVLTASDSPFVDAQANVTVDLLKSLGIKADLQTLDSGTHSVRRTSRKAPAEGGWNIFFSWFPAPTVLNPAVNIPLRSTGDSASWPGWPNIPKIEQLRDAWLVATSEDERAALSAQIEREAIEQVPFIVTGQFTIPRAYRSSLKGLIGGPYPFLWNISKA